MLHRPQTLILSLLGTTSSGPDRISSGTTWCFTARKPLFLRRGAPLHRPEREYERWDVVLHHPQTLIPSSRGTMSSGTDRVSSGGTWCFTARKPLFHRRGAPRPRPRIGLRPVGRGASLPANPYSIVAGHHVLGPEREFRQHAGNEEPKLTAGPFEKDPTVLNVCQAWRKSYG